jgi:hypothetical protein
LEGCGSVSCSHVYSRFVYIIAVYALRFHVFYTVCVHFV